MKLGPFPPDGVAPPRRPEDWSAAERLRTVTETAALGDDELGAYLRRHGLHEATLQEWKAAVLEALGPQKKASSDSRRVREFEKQLPVCTELAHPFAVKLTTRGLADWSGRSEAT